MVTVFSLESRVWGFDLAFFSYTHLSVLNPKPNPRHSGGFGDESFDVDPLLARIWKLATAATGFAGSGQGVGDS